MPRCKPQITLSDVDRARLEATIKTAKRGSHCYKRCVTILDSADGLSVAQIAASRGISTRSIQAYRKIFREGGCDALLNLKPHKGRCGSAGTLAIDRVREEVDRRLSAGLLCTAMIIAAVLKIALSTVKNALRIIRQERGLVRMRMWPVQSEPLVALAEQDLELVGYYLVNGLWILAMSVYPTHDEGRFTGRIVHSIDSSGVETTSCLGTEYKQQTLGLALNSLRSYIPSQDKPLDPCVFTRQLSQDLEQQGAKLALIVCGDIPQELQQDPSLTFIPAASLNEFTALSTKAVKLMDGGHISRTFANAIGYAVKQNADSQYPKTWQAFTAPSSSTQKADHTLPPGAQTLTTVTVQTIDKDGNRLCVEMPFVDIFPRLDQNNGCKTVHEFQNYAGSVEQGLKHIVQNVMPAFLQQFVSAGALRKPLDPLEESTQKAKKAPPQVRGAELESLFLPVWTPIPLTVDTAGLPPRSNLLTPDIKELVITMAETLPYRKLEWFLNVALHRTPDTQFSFRTLDDRIHHWGDEIEEQQLSDTFRSLIEHGFDPKTGKPKEGTELPNSITQAVVSEEEVEQEKAAVKKFVDEYRANHKDFPEIENPHLSILSDPKRELIVQIDAVLVKGQKDHRFLNGVKVPKPATKKQIATHVGYLYWDNNVYVIVAKTNRQLVLKILGFILKYDLLNNRVLVAINDGASEILKDIREIFAFHRPLRVFKDWYHLRERMRGCLSQALYTGVENLEGNKDILNDVLRPLWFGKVEEAKQTLRDIPEMLIRNSDKINEALAYLEKHESEIYCYALRKIAGVINSSNRVEQTNKTVVSYRQKHKGMSWSEKGSYALAILKALMENGHLREWIETGKVPYRPKIEQDEAA